jgi:hypothetical protein
VIGACFEPLNCSFGRFEVGADGACDDAVFGVEVVMREPVTHSRYVGPRNRRLRLEQFGGQCLDRLADLDQTHSDGVEDETVGDVAASDVTADGRYRVGDVG